MLAIVSIAIFYFGFNFLKGVDFLSPTNNYYVIYNDVAGLQTSNPVKINGYNVGRVSDIQILQDRGNKILVEIEISEDIIVGNDASALLDIGLLGTVEIILDVGNTQEPTAKGDTLIAKLDKGLEELLVESALPVADNLQITISRVNVILDSLRGNTQDINESLDNLVKISRRVNAMTYENRGNIRELFENLNDITVILKRTSQQFDPLMNNLNAAADSIRSLEVQQTLDNLNATIGKLDQLLTNINEGEGTLTKLLKEDSLVTNLNSTLEDLDKLLIHMNENPKDFFKPLGRTKKQIEKRRRKEGGQ